MRRRLREHGEIPALPRSNDVWPDHRLRTQVTAGLIAWYKPRTVLDPAFGDGSVVEAAYRLWAFELAWLGDASPANVEALRIRAPHSDGLIADVDTTLRAYQADVIIMTEILEHLEDPDAALSAARKAGTHLVASSPVEEPVGVNNPEHVWSFGIDGYREMLVGAGWKPDTMIELSFTEPGWPYRFQIWGCS